LGAVFLCTTGAEALYSDLGHCGSLNISVSWIFVKIMLILNYLGQGAWIIAHQGAIAADANPFYAIMPKGFLIGGIIMSTGAAIIASQALISGSFTLISEAINLDFWPRMHIKYPGTIKGQLYVPAINMFLFLGCLLTVVIFRSSARMEAAYGLAITVTMLTTTVLLGFYLRSRGVASWITALFMLVFIALEGAFFTANVFKFMHGGWFTVLIAGLLCAIMLAWHIGRRVRSRFIDYKPLDGYVDIITDIRNDREIAKYASNVVYISYSHTEGQVESKLLYSIINKQPKRADHYWIVRIDHVDEPDTLEYSSKTIVRDALFLINLRIGFKVRPQVSVYLRQIVEDLVADNQLNLTSTYPSMMRHSIPGDFRFVIIQRVFSQSSNCKPSERRIMAIYELLRHITITADKALGLDTSTVTVEQVPLIINNRPNRRITRIS
ncbi:KUP/HAK/KT family potassium transporter, partial [uncultured Muribaculum sp.]